MPACSVLSPFLQRDKMQWASLLLLAGLCSLSRAQYDEDPHWWFHYLRSQQSTYYDRSLFSAAMEVVTPLPLQICPLLPPSTRLLEPL